MKSHHNEKSLFLMLIIFVLGSTVLLPVKAQDDLVYVAVEPCRIVDTRNAGGAIDADTSRNFRVSGTAAELAVQGGNSDCLDPKAATGLKPLAVSAYVLAVPATSSTGGGVLTAYPSDQLPPAVGKGSTVNFAAGQIVGNTTNITLCDEATLRAPPSPCPTDGEFAVLARSTDEDVVIDVQGYFYPLPEDGYEVVRETLPAPSQLSSYFYEISCPGGKRALSGGYSFDPPAQYPVPIDVVSSEPSINGDGWSFVYAVNIAIVVEMYFSVICENIAP